MPRPDPQREAGDLVPLEALFENGLMVTSNGAFTRVVEVVPANPLIMSADERVRTAEAFCHLVGRLRAGQELQFYVDSRPVDVASILSDCRAEVAAFAGSPPGPGTPARDALALSRWRLYAAMEDSVCVNASAQNATRTRAFMVVPYQPPRDARAQIVSALRSMGRNIDGAATLTRDAGAHARLARESFAHTEALRGEFTAQGLASRLLNGAEVAELIWSRMNPSAADRGRRPIPSRVQLLDPDLEQLNVDDARDAALKLKDALCESTLDFRRGKHTVEIDRDVEQTIYPSTIAEGTYFGWLMGALLTREPNIMSVVFRKLDRRRERARIKRQRKRLFGVHAGSLAKGNVIDPDRQLQLDEHGALLAEMAGSSRATLFEVAIYQTVRVRGPEANTAALAEAVDYCVDQLESTGDCKVNRGEWQQEELFPSTLPLGVDPARRRRQYVTRNVGDSVPLLGTSCGSPGGVPFCFTEPGQNLERLDLFDREHRNGTMVVVGASGSGKTQTLNTIAARHLALGAAVYAIDRAGHFQMLCNLVDGGRHLDVGSADSPWYLNPWDVGSSESGASADKVAFLLTLHDLMLGGLTISQRSLLGTAIRRVYARAEMEETTPTESALLAELVDRAQLEREGGAPDVAARVAELAEQLGEFCGEGSLAHIFDRQTTVPTDAPVIVFDLRFCPEVAMGPVMLLVTEFIKTRVQQRNREARTVAARADAPAMAGKTLLLLDEAWRLVAREDVGEYANDLARRARHWGLAMLVSSQQASDFNTKHGVALLRNATIRLLLSQDDANETAFLQAALQLSDAEARLLTRLQTRKGSHAEALWINGTRGRAKVALRLSGLEYWAFTSEPNRDVPAREAAIARHGGSVWPALADLAGKHTPATPAPAPATAAA